MWPLGDPQKQFALKGRREPAFVSITTPFQLPYDQCPFPYFAWQLQSHAFVTTVAVPYSQAGIWSSYRRGQDPSPPPYLGISSFGPLGTLLLTCSPAVFSRHAENLTQFGMGCICHCLSHISLETQLMYSFSVSWPPVSAAGDRANNKPTAQHWKACVR